MESFKIDEYESVRDLYDSWVKLYSDFVYKNSGGEDDMSQKVMRNLLRESYGVDIYFISENISNHYFKGDYYYRMSTKKLSNSVKPPYRAMQCQVIDGLTITYGVSATIHGMKFKCGVNQDDLNIFLLGVKILKFVYNSRKENNVSSN